MNFRENIEHDAQSALRSRDELTLSVLRMLLSAMHNREIEKRRASGSNDALGDEEVIHVIRAELKKRTDAIEAYEKGARPDAVKREQGEAEILRSYLPPELSHDELFAIVEEGITTLGVHSEKDFGKLMGWVMQRVKGRASGDRVLAIAKRSLGAP